MHILAAPDKFKESMSAATAAAAIAAGVRDADPASDCIEIPLSDGGDGFVATLAGPMQAELIEISCSDALGRPRKGSFALAGHTAVIEMAQAAGLAAIPVGERDIMNSSTRGVGQLISAALDRGATDLVVGLGGSATTDGGAGMLTALGVRLLDAAGGVLDGTPRSLADLDYIDTSGIDPRLRTVSVTIASDVRNPMLGATGAAAVFGPQKGASPAQVAELDETLAHFVTVADAKAAAAAPGAGAAGGLGFGLLAFLGAKFRPGIDVVLDLTGFDEFAAAADWVFTGEGAMDGQTLQGKAPLGVAERARAAGAGVIGFAGHFGAGTEALLDAGFTALVPIVSEVCDLQTALAAGPDNLRRAAAMTTRLLVAGAHSASTAPAEGSHQPPRRAI